MCRFDDARSIHPVHELSALGFSFLCSRDDQLFKRGVFLDRISILNEERREIISASGTVVHATQFDLATQRIGVLYSRKTLDRTIAGTIRTPRRIPKVAFGALLEPPQAVGQGVSGAVQDFTATTARVVAESGLPEWAKVGDEIRISIAAEDTVLLSTAAHVIQRRDGRGEIIVQFTDQLLDVARVETVASALASRPILLSSLSDLERYRVLPARYKALIADWAMYLQLLQQVLDQEEKKGIYKSKTEQKLFLTTIEEDIFDKLNRFVHSLNDIVNGLNPAECLAYKEYFRENLQFFVRKTPLGASIIDKELGYAGDFRTIKQFFQDPYDGNSLFEKLFNKFIWSTDAAKAHQRRIAFLREQLDSTYDHCKEEFLFLSLGSGPAEEVLSFVADRVLDKPVTATLIDMDAYALMDFSERVQYHKQKSLSINLINANILSIVKKGEQQVAEERHHLTYCAGLLDYFRKQVSKRIMKFLIDRTLPGGTIVVTNVHASNKTRHFMDYAGGWEVIHRDERQMEQLVPPGYEHEFHYDENRTNMFMKILVPGG
jgi:extracellular factor (EF) 3-hydroxypalmitic acid methyl ester biosynthesis protein